MDHEADQHGRPDIPPIPVKREFVAIYSDGTGGRWFLVFARSAEEVSIRYPMLDVFELADAPSVGTMDLERLRVFVAPGVDPVAPARGRDAAARDEFLAYRDRVLREVAENNARSNLPREVAERMHHVPQWIDIDDDAGFVEYLRTLPAPYSR